MKLVDLVKVDQLGICTKVDGLPDAEGLAGAVGDGRSETKPVAAGTEDEK